MPLRPQKEVWFQSMARGLSDENRLGGHESWLTWDDEGGISALRLQALQGVLCKGRQFRSLVWAGQETAHEEGGHGPPAACRPQVLPGQA